MGLVENSVMFLVGFGPMAFLLYFGLRRYADRFDYARSTMMLFIGIIAGVFLAVAHVLSESIAGGPAGLLIIEVILALIANLFILFVFNRERFAGKHDTPFFGAVLGGGIGSMIPLGLAYLFVIATASSGLLLSPGILLQLVVIAFIQVAARSSAAALVAYGVYTREVLQFTAYGVAVQVGAYAIMIPGMMQNPAAPDYGILALTFGGSLAFALLAYGAVVGGLFPRCVPPPEKKAKKIAFGTGGRRETDGSHGESGTPRPQIDIIGADGSPALWKTGK